MLPERTGHPSLAAAREMEILLIKGAKFIESNFGAHGSRGSLDVEEVVQHERVSAAAVVHYVLAVCLAR